MHRLTLSYVAHTLGIPFSGTDRLCTGVSIDTRTLLPGNLFVALTGAHVNGHDYIREAQTKGAVAVLVSQKIDAGIPSFVVPDTLRALGYLAKKYRAQFEIPMIAVTGSYGKTTVKEMLASILSIQGATLATQGNLNNEIGVPLTLLRLLPEHRAAVIEMGARRKNDIRYLMSLSMPTVSVLNNAGVAHIEMFGSKENIAHAKGEIFSSLGENGTAIINRDDQYADYWAGLLANQQRIIHFGVSEDADFRATQIRLEPQGSHFTLTAHDLHTQITLASPGEHNIKNALASAAGASALGVPLNTIKLGLEAFRPATGRLEFKVGISGASIIDDTYNANPDSMRAALSVLAKAQGAKILVMGDMFELGDAAESFHQKMGEEAKQLGVNQLFGIGQFTEFAVKRFGNNGFHYQSKADLITNLLDAMTPHTTILVKGSRGMRMEEIVWALTTDMLAANEF